MMDAFLYFGFCTAVLVLVVVLFHIERVRGRRFFGGVRARIDFMLLKVRHMVNVRFRNWSRYFVRQIIHYFLHTFLMGAIKSLDLLENRLKTIARSNRSMARSSDRERTVRNTLEEVALHKMEVALTEEEKRIHKQRSLEG